MSEWQPIKTAPSDGRDIWVLGGRFDEPTVREADGDWWRNSLLLGSRITPTMWAPVKAPTPPERPTMSDVRSWLPDLRNGVRGVE